MGYRGNRSTKMNLCQTKTLLLLVLGSAFATAGCAQEQAGSTDHPAGPSGEEAAPGVRLVGHLAAPRLTESSGVVASRRFPGVFWTHNDGGGPKRQQLFAISRQGAAITEFRVSGVLLRDWEDIAIDDDGHLFVADVGNNDSKRSELAVHQIDEPDPKSVGGNLGVKQSWRLAFPGEPFDCESLFVWKGYGYVVSKVFKNAHAAIYRFPLKEQPGPLVLELVATTKIQSPVTGADLSPDGRLLALVAKSGAFVYRLDGDLARAAKVKPVQVRFRHEHIEGCCFVPDGLLATSESREIYLFTDEAFRWQ